MGSHPHNQRAWLWVAVTPLVSFFQVMLARSTAAAQALLVQFQGTCCAMEKKREGDIRELVRDFEDSVGESNLS